MADEVSPGEAYRRLLDHEQRTDRARAELDNRITNLARDTTPLAVYQTAEKARDAEIQRLEREHDMDIAQVRREHTTDIAQVRDEIKELRERPQMTLGRWLAVGSVVAAVLGVLVEAWAALKGVHVK